MQILAFFYEYFLRNKKKKGASGRTSITRIFNWNTSCTWLEQGDLGPAESESARRSKLFLVGSRSNPPREITIWLDLDQIHRHKVILVGSRLILVKPSWYVLRIKQRERESMGRWKKKVGTGNGEKMSDGEEISLCFCSTDQVNYTCSLCRIDANPSFPPKQNKNNKL